MKKFFFNLSTTEACYLEKHTLKPQKLIIFYCGTVTQYQGENYSVRNYHQFLIKIFVWNLRGTFHFGGKLIKNFHRVVFPLSFLTQEIPTENSNLDNFKAQFNLINKSWFLLQNF